MRLMGPRSIAVIPAATSVRRNNDVEYPFRQDSNFAYLTGLHQPDAILVLAPKSKMGEYTLFCVPGDKHSEIWDGPRVNCKDAVRDYAANKAYPVEQFEDVLLSLLADREFVYWTDVEAALRKPPLFETISAGSGSWFLRLKRLCAGLRQQFRFIPVTGLIHELRLRKSPAEIKLMKQAATIAATAHKRAMRHCRPGMYEFEVEAEILYEFNRAGAVPAYPSIVGGGKNACILHYIKNDCILREGDLLLIDAGAEYAGYASDITRTFPVNGFFSSPQQELYEIVLDAQNKAISKVKVGNLYSDYHAAAVRVLTKGLKEIGLLKGSLNTLIKKQEYARFYMHGTGHWLGMDVHDAGDYRVNGAWRRLESGMVMTVEPGLYISPADDIPKCWWNIGIRIEDDIRVTAQGPEIITSNIPRQMSEIEALMADG